MGNPGAWCDVSVIPLMMVYIPPAIIRIDTMMECTPLQNPLNETVKIETLAATYSMNVSRYRNEWVAIASGMLLTHGPDLAELMEMLDSFEGHVEYHLISDEVLDQDRRKCVQFP